MILRSLYKTHENKDEKNKFIILNLLFKLH